MSDIVKRLRAISSSLSARGFAGCDKEAESLCHEAAAEIEQLREERDAAMLSSRINEAIRRTLERWRCDPEATDFDCLNNIESLLANTDMEVTE